MRPSSQGRAAGLDARKHRWRCRMGIGRVARQPATATDRLPPARPAAAYPAEAVRLAAVIAAVLVTALLAALGAARGDAQSPARASGSAAVVDRDPGGRSVTAAASGTD